MAGKVTAEEYKKVKDYVNSNFTSDSLSAYSKAYKEAMSGGATAKEAYASASGLLKKIDAGGTSTGGTSSSGGSSNTAASGGTNSGITGAGNTSGGTSSRGTSTSGDIYGDKSKNATTTSPMDFSNYTGSKTLSKEDAIFGKDAEARDFKEAGFLTNRNNTIAYELKNKGITDKDKIEEYLNNTYDTFYNADAGEKANTVNAIKLRLGEITKSDGETEIKDTTKVEEGNGTWDKFTSTFKDYNGDGKEDKPGYYYENGEYYKAYGYDSWSKEEQDMFDRLPDNKKKEVSNKGAEALQEYLKLGTDYKRDTEYLDKKHDIDTDLYRNSKRQAEIQMGQTLRHAEEGVNNLIQNWQYLGNMGMPGVSAVKLKAISDAIGEAKITLGEIEELEGLKMDAMENQWKEQELAYAKQIDDLTYNLTWQTSQEFVNWLGKFSAAELEGQLDTIDGITAFRREMLDNLDKNLSGITSASLSQMQYITQQYQDIADKMYEYQQNANTVNKDMSAVKGYYVDGNGNPIFNAKGETIEVPQSAPMDPIYDKETGKLITFAYDENGQIVAQVQDVLGLGGSGGIQGTIVSLLEQGASVQDILKMYPNVDLKTVQALAEVVKPIGGGIKYSDYTWKGADYTPVSREKASSAALKTAVSGTGGWCGAYVNKYLQSLGFAPSFIKDSLQSKLDIINTEDGYTPQVGDVVVFDYNHITPETGENNGHVGIVVGFRNGKMIVRDSNFDGDRQIKNREVSLDNKAIQGYFNPTKSINNYNNEVKSAVYEAQGLNSKGFRDNDTANYNNYLKKGDSAFTNADKERIAKSYGSYEAFQDAATAYQQNLDNQVSDVSIDLLKTLYKIKKMGSTDYWMAKNEPEWAMQRGIGTGGDWRTEIDHVIANTTLEKLVNMKSQGATFGALSEGELDMLNSSANKLNYTSSYKKFMENVDDMIAGIEGSMDMRGYDYSELKNEGGSTTTTTNNGPKPGGNVT